VICVPANERPNAQSRPFTSLPKHFIAIQVGLLLVPTWPAVAYWAEEFDTHICVDGASLNDGADTCEPFSLPVCCSLEIGKTAVDRWCSPTTLVHLGAGEPFLDVCAAGLCADGRPDGQTDDCTELPIEP
jgi:hypothetical protein